MKTEEKGSMKEKVDSMQKKYDVSIINGPIASSIKKMATLSQGSCV